MSSKWSAQPSVSTLASTDSTLYIASGVSSLITVANQAKALNAFSYFTKAGSGATTAFSGGDQSGNARGSLAIDVQSARNNVANAATGAKSSAFGYNNKASGADSQAFGYKNISTGTGSQCFGEGNNVTVASSCGFGYYNTITVGSSNNAFGYHNNASTGTLNSAFGTTNTATGGKSAAFGYKNGTVASSAAFGYINNVTGTSTLSSAVGCKNTVTNAIHAVSFGYHNTASGTGACAVGGGNTASGGPGNAFGGTNTASGTKSNAFGQNNQATASQSQSFGYNCIVGVANGSAFGLNNTVNAAGSQVFGYSNTSGSAGTVVGVLCSTSGTGPMNAFGYKAVNRITNTTVICGPIINRKDAGDTVGNAFQTWCGAEVVLFTNQIDFTALATYTINIPASAHFYPVAVGAICSAATTVTIQPTCSFGFTGSNAAIKAAAITTALTAIRTCQDYTTLLTNAGQTSLTATVTIVATATGSYFGRFYFRGLLVEDN